MAPRVFIHNLGFLTFRLKNNEATSSLSLPDIGVQPRALQLLMVWILDKEHLNLCKSLETQRIPSTIISMI